MTTRKRLTDMVREEVQKSPELELMTVEVMVEESANSITDLGDQTQAIAKLQASLAESVQREKAFQQNIASLEAEFQTQKEHLQRSQAYLEQASQVKAELDRLQQENQLLKAANETMKKSQGEIVKPLSRADQETKRISQLLYRPVGSNATQNQLNNQNIGWFD
jgi:DNA repair exonuclease SbcCD ATPase subunit